MQTEEPLIGISSCLLGEKVRFNGGHKRNAYAVDTLGQFMKFVPVCPEVESGMSTPRETVRLVRDSDDIRMVAPKSETDYTASMERFSRSKVAALEKQNLSGFLLKKDSPSCGVFRVKVYDHNQVPSKTGRGMFAHRLLEKMPLLPVEEEGRLQDPRLRENFIERVFAYQRLRRLFDSRWSVGKLVVFHTQEKMLLRCHNETAYRDLGKMVAAAKQTPRAELKDAYQRRFMEAMTTLATTKKHTNVLQHMFGYFRDVLSPQERSQMRQVVEDYRQGFLPLIAPITMIRHFVQLHGIAYLADQTYLSPHPKELMLRNHV